LLTFYVFDLTRSTSKSLGTFANRLSFDKILTKHGARSYSYLVGNYVIVCTLIRRIWAIPYSRLSTQPQRAGNNMTPAMSRTVLAVIRRSCEREGPDATMTMRAVHVCRTPVPANSLPIRLHIRANTAKWALRGGILELRFKHSDPSSPFIIHQPSRVSDTRVARSKRRCGDAF
jgi:hypothetical protein